jgi:hypothetical protein
MQGRKFQLKTNMYANFQEHADYQDSGGMLVFDGMAHMLFLTLHSM